MCLKIILESVFNIFKIVLRMVLESVSNIFKVTLNILNIGKENRHSLPFHPLFSFNFLNVGKEKVGMREQGGLFEIILKIDVCYFKE